MQNKRYIRYILSMLLMMGSILSLSAQSSDDDYNPDNPSDPNTPAQLGSYTVTLTSNLAGAGTQAGAGTYEYGRTVTIKAAPNANYGFRYWLKDNDPTPYSTATSFSYTIGTENVTFQAVYYAFGKVTLRTNPEGAGTQSGMGSYDRGKDVTIKTTPAKNYRFLYWVKGNELTPYSYDASFHYTMGEEDVEFCAMYEKSRTVTLKQNDSKGGVVSGDLTQLLEEREETSIVGTATTSSTNTTPFRPYYKYSTSETIYKASEVGNAGKILSIAYNVATKSALSATVKVYLAHTSKQKFSSTTDYIPAKDMTLVYSGTVSLAAATGWQTINLNTPFEYNGVDNLAVIVTKSASSYNGTQKYYYTSAADMCLYRQSNSYSSYADVNNTSYAFTKDGNRPNTKFIFEPFSKFLESTTISTTVNPDYDFVHWLKDEDEEHPYSTETSFVYRFDQQNVTFTAIYHYNYNAENPADPSNADNMANYNVVVKLNDEQAGIVTGAGKYSVGQSVAISTQANENYVFRKWQKDDEDYSESPSFTYVVTAKDVTFTAIYDYVAPIEPDPDGPGPDDPDTPQEATHQLHLLAEPAGSCTFSLADGTAFKAGDSFNVTATPTTSFRFIGWYVDDVKVETSTIYSGTMQDEDITVRAVCYYSPEVPEDPTLGEVEPRAFVQVDGLYYYIFPDRHEATLVNADGSKQVETGSYSGHIFLPASIVIDNEEYRITAISKNAFSACYALEGLHMTASMPSVITACFIDIIESCTLYVPYDRMSEYESTLGWASFNTIVGELELTDGEEFSFDADCEDVSVTYHRNFTTTTWQPLYVPFAISYDVLAKDFDVARLNAFYEYDDDDDGVIDRAQLEVIKVMEGVLKPNHPYMIRAHVTGKKDIVSGPTWLTATVSNSIDCSTVETHYTFTGVYRATTAEEKGCNIYAMNSKGALSSVKSVKAFRWYMTAQDKEGQFLTLPEAIELGIVEDNSSAGGDDEGDAQSGGNEMNPDAATIELNDGEEYSGTETVTGVNIVYNRNFTTTTWQPLYVPFAMQYASWKDQFDVACINAFYQYDDDEDGVIDRAVMELIKVKNKILKPNHPYLIRAHATGQKTFEIGSTTLFPASLTSISCSTVETSYTFSGTYSRLTAAELGCPIYAMNSKGSLSSVSSVKPCRWYMTVADREGQMLDLPESLFQVRMLDDENEPEAIEIIHSDNESTSASYYTLDGKQIVSPTKGLTIMRLGNNNTKIIIK